MKLPIVAGHHPSGDLKAREEEQSRNHDPPPREWEWACMHIQRDPSVGLGSKKARNNLAPPTEPEGSKRMEGKKRGTAHSQNVSSSRP